MILHHNIKQSLRHLNIKRSTQIAFPPQHQPPHKSLRHLNIKMKYMLMIHQYIIHLHHILQSPR